MSIITFIPKVFLYFFALLFMLLALVQVWAWPGLFLDFVAVFSAITAYRRPERNIFTILAHPAFVCMNVSVDLWEKATKL